MVSKQKRRNYWAAGVIIAFLAVGLAIFLGYWFKWDWTGFNEHIGPNGQQYQPAKTLWDWLNLLGVLAIPAVVGLGATWYTAQQGKVSEKENTDNQREVALQAYIDKMSELLLEKHLRNSTEDDEVRKIARVRTLTVLPRLDPDRKYSMLQFLYESGLIEKDQRIIDLDEADLSNLRKMGAKLRKANLRRANLSAASFTGIDLSDADLTEANLIKSDLNGYLLPANLSRADLSKADLMLADLAGANLSGANLSQANLNAANLRDADLAEADLRKANLRFADLSRSNLKGAILSEVELSDPKQLYTAKSLQGAIMPDGSIHP